VNEVAALSGRQLAFELLGLLVDNPVAILARDAAKLDQSLQADLEKKGMAFTKPDIDSFRAKLRTAGFYQEWRGKVGNEAWVLLEKYVGKLG